MNNPFEQNNIEHRLIENTIDNQEIINQLKEQNKSSLKNGFISGLSVGIILMIIEFLILHH